MGSGAASSGSPLSRSEEDGLFHEHNSLVQLFIHEDVMAWRFVIAIATANSAIFVAAHALNFQDVERGAEVALYVILFAGIALNAAAALMFRRGEIHRRSRLFRAYTIEKRLHELGCPVSTFSSTESLMHRGFKLKAVDGHPMEDQFTEPLRIRERLPSLSVMSTSKLFALFFLIAVIWVHIGKPVP